MPHRSVPHPAAPDESAGVQPADLRPFMAAFPTGVSVVTTLDGESVPHGLTCTSLASVALEPATLVVCVRAASPTLAVLLAEGHFALNLLHERARGTSDLFASGAPDRFDHVEWRLPLGAGGPHLTADAHAVADCAVVRTVGFGDHTAVFAEVRRVTVRDDPEPCSTGCAGTPLGPRRPRPAAGGAQRPAHGPAPRHTRWRYPCHPLTRCPPCWSPFRW